MYPYYFLHSILSYKSEQSDLSVRVHYSSHHEVPCVDEGSTKKVVNNPFLVSFGTSFNIINTG